MSFLPISEALQRLEHEGLVESRPRVGTRVRVPTVQDVRDNYVVREALESQSARLFAEKASSAEREEMMRMAREVDAMRADPDIEFFDFFAFHERFHRRIAECTGCAALTVAIEKTNTLIRTWHYAALTDYRKMPTEYHARLMGVLTAGNPEEADRVMREHVRYGMDDVLQRLEPFFQGEGGAPVARRSSAIRGH
jgi:DNA-binding GntR family transcriptional regulator